MRSNCFLEPYKFNRISGLFRGIFNFFQEKHCHAPFGYRLQTKRILIVWLNGEIEGLLA